MPNRQRLFPVTLWTDTDLDNGLTLESAVIQCFRREPDILMFQVTNAGGSADVKIEYAVSNDGVNFNSYTSQDAICTSTATVYASQGPEEYHAMIVPSAPYIKIKVTDLASLDDNVVNATLWVRDEA